jgi:penicillin-binding protein 1A
MAMDNTTGDVLAMVGGRDYALSQFNRATQSERQTGSSFKIYDYTAAIEDGAKPDDIIVDGPVSFGSYTPHNYENDYRGAMTLTSAFAESRNIPALKLAARVGIHKVIDLTHRFGVTANIPAYLPIAIGAVEITLEEQVASYSVFPNDGLRVAPRLIRKVENSDGITLWEEPPAVNEVIDQKTARTMMTLLEAVMQHGTGSAAAQLNHPLGGKTGTTSDYTDAWFLGFSPSVTCGVWVGFDNRESLGDKETGAKAALPIWMNVMRVAIAGKDGERFLGEEKKESPTLEASVRVPAKPASAAKSGSTGAMAKAPSAPPAAGSAAKPLKANATAKPPTAPTTGTASLKTSAQPAAKPTSQPVAGTKPLVKPALPSQPTSVRPAGTVKPAALHSAASSPKPKDPQ